MARQKIYNSLEEKHLTRKKRAKEGFCYTCGKANDKFPTGIRCTICQEKQNYSRRILRNKRYKKNLCGCGKNKWAGIRCKQCWFEMHSVNLYNTVAKWQELQKLWDKQQGCCFYTGEKLIPGKTASIDHIVAKTKNGTNDINNLQWVSKLVNTMKWNTEHSKFIAICEIITKRNKNNTLG